MSYIKAVEKHKKKKNKTEQQTHDEFLSEQMKKGAEEVMTDGLFTKFVGGKDFFSDELRLLSKINHNQGEEQDG